MSFQARSYLQAKRRFCWAFTVSPDILLPLVMMMTMILSMAVPSQAALSDNQFIDIDMDNPPLSISCYGHFRERVHSCVRPFTSLLQLFEDNSSDLTRLTLVLKHICLEYQMVLLCLHSALNDCPTMVNLRRVQTTLDTQWVAKTNQLCSIGSGRTNNQESRNYQHLGPFLSRLRTPELQALYLAKEIIDAYVTIVVEDRMDTSFLDNMAATTSRPSQPSYEQSSSPVLQSNSRWSGHRITTVVDDADLALSSYSIFQNKWQTQKAQVGDSHELGVTKTTLHQSYNSAHRISLFSTFITMIPSLILLSVLFSLAR